MVLTHLHSSSLLPQPYIAAKPTLSGHCWARGSFSSLPGKSYPKAQVQFRYPLCCQASAILGRENSPFLSLRSLHNTCSIASLWHLLCCSLATCFVSASLARLGPLGSAQRLSQCESSSVSTTKMPNKDCGFITYGQEGPHTGCWQRSQWSHS